GPPHLVARNRRAPGNITTDHADSARDAPARPPDRLPLGSRPIPLVGAAPLRRPALVLGLPLAAAVPRHARARLGPRADLPLEPGLRRRMHARVVLPDRAAVPHAQVSPVTSGLAAARAGRS